MLQGDVVCWWSQWTVD